MFLCSLLLFLIYFKIVLDVFDEISKNGSFCQYHILSKGFMAAITKLNISWPHKLFVNMWLN